MRRERKVTVIGAGPAGLMAATAASEAGAAVTLFEGKPSPGRKLLVAGKGGLNLTNAEPLESFLQRYREAAPRLEPFLRAFPPQALRTFADSLGQPTYVGSSRRVFPRSGKAAPLLRAWVARLKRSGVRLAVRHRWMGLTPDGAAVFDTPRGTVTVPATATVLALGGASWPETGSDAGWVPILEARGVEVAELVPANAGVEIGWPPGFAERAAGKPLKNVSFACGGEAATGEALVTHYGLEGPAIYRLGPAIRKALGAGPAELRVDLKPSLDAPGLARRLAGPKSLATKLKALKLDPAARALGLATRSVKDIRLEVKGFRPIAEAISSAGGVRWSQVDEHLMLRALPGVFVAGEMLDWEAPTGGYLLQACFASGQAAGLAAASW